MALFDFLKKNRYLIHNPEYYAEKEMDIIALTRTGTNSGKFDGDKGWSASVKLLAYVEEKSGRLVEEPTWVRWDLTDIDAARLSRKGDLKQETAYLLRVRPSRVRLTMWCNQQVPAGRVLFVTKVLKRGVSHPELDRILEERRRPRSITLSDGMSLNFESRYNRYSGITDWQGGESTVVLYADEENFGCADKAAEVFETILADRAGWDKRAREFAAKELTASANEWRKQEGEDEHIITRAEFARRIGTPDVFVDSDGNFSFIYDDDDMFLGHFIVISGSVRDGFTDATFEG